VRALKIRKQIGKELPHGDPRNPRPSGVLVSRSFAEPGGLSAIVASPSDTADPALPVEPSDEQALSTTTDAR